MSLIPKAVSAYLSCIKASLPAQQIAKREEKVFFEERERLEEKEEEQLRQNQGPQPGR